MSIEDIRNERIKKLDLLREKGIDSYPAKTQRTHSVAEILKKFAAFAKKKERIVLAGRVMAKREHGGSMFLDLRDGSGKIQIYFKKDVLADGFDLALETIDIGDFIEIEGPLFKTKREEETIEVKIWTMLAKSLRPLPEKWHGLQDVEERFRRRYLDLLMNDEVRSRFEMRFRIIRAIREFFDKEGFVEVETPMLHLIAGGALAKPFTTHHNALDTDLYLRVAPELYLKRLLVGGFEKVYELGKNFRNEGIDAEHNPEFTSVEWYAAYWDEEAMMKNVEQCLAYILKVLGIKNEIEFDGRKIVFEDNFPRITFRDLLSRYALITDYDRETRDSLAVRAKQLGIEVEPHEAKGKIADEIYKKICRPYVAQPTFVTGHPLDISPLAKKNEKFDTARRFQLILAGYEIVNAFSELNDPLDQQARFEEQEKMRAGGASEVHPPDEDFVEALEYGMPPAAGAAIGIDRLVMILTGAKNIREVVLFPTLRPK